MQNRRRADQTRVGMKNIIQHPAAVYKSDAKRHVKKINRERTIYPVLLLLLLYILC